MSTQASAATDQRGTLKRPFEPILPSALEGSVSDCFAAIARRFGSHLALDDGSRTLTYSELAALADDIAAATSAATADQAGPVALLFHHEARFPAAILGVLAAGRACIPLDAEYPIARNRMIASHAGAVAVVSAGALAAQAQTLFPNLPVIDIEILQQAKSLGSGGRPTPDDVAYVLYTSGSTGTPKGVYQNHRGVIHDIMQCVNAQRLSCEDRVALFYSPTVASGFRIALSALLVGASLHILPPRELGGRGLASAIRGRGITVFRAAAALFRHVVEALGPDERLDSLRLVVLGGDRVDWSDFDLFKRSCSANARFGVHLGATEVSLYLEWYVDEAVRANSRLLPVGRTVPDRTTLLLSEDGRPVADGEIGEFTVSSPYIALGYWPPSELTEPFSTDPANPNTRLYRTGDLGRRRPDGLYEHVGRKDHQIKLHGYRIEPAEIEIALKNCAGVRDAAIVARRDAAGVPLSIIGYVEPQPGISAPTPEYLLPEVAQQVPRHMVPLSIFVLDALPRLPNLKIDRVRLGELDVERVRQAALKARGGDALTPPAEHLAMRDEVIAALRHAAGTRPTLRRQLTNSNNDLAIADLGIDSLHFIAWCMEIQARTGVELGPEDLAVVGSLDELVSLVLDLQKRDRSGRDPIWPTSRDKPFPLSFAQERIWNHHATNSAAYAVGMSDEIRGRLATDVLRECLGLLVQRHDILRTTFQVVNGEPVQIVHPATPVTVPMIDLDPDLDADEQVNRIVREEMSKVCNLAGRPLIRFSLVRMSDTEYRLLRVYHHILADAWSGEVLLGELAALYQARLEGKNPPAGPAIQYADYAAWQRRTFHPGGMPYKRTVAWWKQRFTSPWPTTALPFKRRFPVRRVGPEDGRVAVPVDAGTEQRLQQLRRECRATDYTIWLAALIALLSAETKQRKIAIGTYVTTRRRPDLQNVIGDFTCLAVLGFQCDLAMSFRDWVDEVRNCVAQTEQHSELPHDVLRNAIPHLPHVQVIFGAPIEREEPRAFADLTVRRRGPTRPSGIPWGFSLGIHKSSKGHSCRAAFDARIHNPAAVKGFMQRMCGLLDAVSREPDLQLKEAWRMANEKLRLHKHDSRPFWLRDWRIEKWKA
jgi:amino acid adenylation domain-containing protein